MVVTTKGLAASIGRSIQLSDIPIHLQPSYIPLSEAEVKKAQQEFCDSRSCIARGLDGEQRKKLAIKVLAKMEPVTQLADTQQVSRKFLYKQADKAESALDEVFKKAGKEDEVLFYLPVTKQWLRQVVVALPLMCRSSYRGVIEFFDALLDQKISLGTVSNIMHQAMEDARQVNDGENLSSIKVPLLDEIFQAGKPVLAVADATTTYCCLLKEEESRDADTWGLNLLELTDKGIDPDYSVADFGKGIRAGHAEAWPGVPCRGDVFHALLGLGKLAFYLENRACGVMAALEKLERKMLRAKNKSQGNKLSKKLAAARSAENHAVPLADDIMILATWMREDILSVSGPEYDKRREIFDFVVEELRAREPLAPHRVGPIRKLLENQRDELLAFVRALDQGLEEIARQFSVPLFLIRQLFEALGRPSEQNIKWSTYARLQKQLGHLFVPIREAVSEIMTSTVRASSLVENLNSRLRNYFFLRRQLGPGYLDLLRFFLNHRRFMRSELPERQGKSPAELLTGKQHDHWLEILGFERFRKAA